MLLDRRMTIPLAGDGEATMTKLMKDDSAYTFSELPRINPHHKVTVWVSPAPAMGSRSNAGGLELLAGSGNYMMLLCS